MSAFPLQRLIVFGLKGVAIALSLMRGVTHLVADDGKPANPPAVTSEWIPDKLYLRLGSTAEHPGSFVVFTPRNVVEAFTHILKEKPETWRVRHIFSWTAHGTLTQIENEIALIYDRAGNSVTCRITPERWTRLNDKGGLPVISEIMQENFFKDVITREVRTPQSFDKAGWSDFLDSVIFLYDGVSAKDELSRKFLEEHKDSLTSLMGTEKNPESLRALCGDPVVVDDKDRLQVSAHYLTVGGAIEKWTLVLQPHNALQITEIKVERLYREGSFQNSGRLE